MRTYLILFLLFSFNINADELDVFFEALNKDYLFNEIVYENGQFKTQINAMCFFVIPHLMWNPVPFRF